MLEETLNKALDYTRGNNTYLQCVNNNLEYTARALSNMEYGLRSDIQDLRSDVQSAAVGMYNMGLGIRDDIQTSTAMNINAIESMSMGLTSGIRASTYAIVASQEMLNQTFKQGFNSVNNTINLGLGLVGNKIDVLSEEIYTKLDEIQEIVDNPRLTASRELYRQALISYRKGFYEEALEDCLGAVEKNKTDYISWYLLGLIYLFGAGENGNVINLDKAEEAFANAAKYIKPDIPESDEAQLMASEIFYHLGFTRLAKSNDYLIENKADESNIKLLEAENASSMAYQLSKENLIAGYEYAKELHFLGKDDESLKLLEELIRKEKKLAIKAVNDKNFESLWGDIEKLIEKLKLEICNPIPKKLKETIDFYENKLKANDEIANYELRGNYRDSNIEVFQKKAYWLQQKYSDIEKKDYFSVLLLKEQLSGDLEKFGNEITNLIHATKEDIRQKKEEELRRQEYERRLEEEKRKREEERKKEEERRASEELWRHAAECRKREEEEKKRKEEERKQEEERREKEAILRNFKKAKSIAHEKCIWLVLLLAIQWGCIIYSDYFEYVEFLPILAGIISAIGLIVGWGTFTVGMNLLGCSAVASFILGHPVIGIINSIVIFFSSLDPIDAGNFDDKESENIDIKSFRNKLLITLYRNFFIIFFVTHYIVYDDNTFWGIVLFVLAAICGACSSILGGILWIAGAILLFFTGHIALGIISIIVALLAFFFKNELYNT